MTTYTQYTINATGKARIAEILMKYYKGCENGCDSRQIEAWATEAERDGEESLAANGYATIELSQHGTHGGHTETHDLSLECFDAREVEIDG